MKKHKNLSHQARGILADFNCDDFPRLKFKRAVELFEFRAKELPKKIAIESGNKKVTYKELDDRARRIGDFLTVFLGKNQQKIYVLADNSIETIIAFLGILKSGNILIPLNPQYPFKIIKEIFQDVRPDFVISEKKYLKLLRPVNKSLRLGVLIIDDQTAVNYKKGNLEFMGFGNLDDFCGLRKKSQRERNNSNACIYFTSGSTGRFKAVLMSDSCLAFGSELAIKKYIRTDSRFGHFFSIYMHTSLTRGIMPALCGGATLCIFENDLLFDIPRMISWLEKNRVSLISCPAPIFKYLAEEIRTEDQLKKLKHVLVMADKLNNGNYLKNFFDKIGSRVKLVNLYGSTEAPVGFRYEISKTDLKKNIMPVGRSPAAKAVVLNENRQVQPPGAVGEIFIRSPYLAAGYYNDATQTAKVFIKNPFSRKIGDIIYRTGDLGLISSGNLECLGRVDQQVKIGGKRIELGAVEAAVQKRPDVKDAVVVMWKDSLAAYFVAEKKISPADFRAYLKNILPDFMIPHFFSQLDRLPLTPNGKIDRRFLSMLKPPAEKKSRSPITDLQKKIVKIWQEVLELDNVGINDNFFDAGGNSLKIIEINRKLKELGVNLSSVVLFKCPTIQALTDYLATKEYPPGKSAGSADEGKKNLLSQSANLLRQRI